MQPSAEQMQLMKQRGEVAPAGARCGPRGLLCLLGHSSSCSPADALGWLMGGAGGAGTSTALEKMI